MRKFKKIQNYTILRIINEGYQGIVYEVVDSLGEKYALKKMRMNKYSDRECRNLINISLKYCINLVDSFIYKGEYRCLVHKCYQCSLQDFLDKNDFIPLETIKKWGMQIALGMNSLHEKNIIHRDLKPGNILLTEDNYHADIVIADFGFSIDITQEKAISSVGTRKYAAPEIMNENYTNKVDVYSYGVLMYFLIFRTFPKVSKKKQLKIPETNLINDSSECLEFLKKTLSYNPESRPSFVEISNDNFLKGKYFAARAYAMKSTNDPELSFDDKIRKYIFGDNCNKKIN